MNTNIRIITSDWDTNREMFIKIRREVFIVEQNAPEQIELDEMDSLCTHALVFDARGGPVGTGRLAPDGKIGRMAVMKSYRKTGIGTAIMKKLLEADRDKGIKNFYLNSQTEAIGFYEKFGFAADGSIFQEAGIDHVRMILQHY